ncbi:hypothetical protein [Streptomyces sp. cmx-18-6]|uniref:hypothetical protein n=1 Tax=Streptomyces sp. cmx-18-6 TaxID=2790930 RepID=UPI00398063C9
MVRAIRSGLISGAVVVGALLLAAVPASAAPASADTSSGKVVLAADRSTAQTAQAAGCRYGGWIQYSDGTVVHVYICD